MLLFSLFLKFYYYVCKQLDLDTLGVKNLVNDVNNAKNTSKYAQYYQIISNSQSSDGAVGKPLVHMSAIQQTTGNIFNTNINESINLNLIIVYNNKKRANRKWKHFNRRIKFTWSKSNDK